MIRLIALTGRAHSGKSSLAKMLAKTVPLAKFHQYAFASPIKLTVNALFGWDQRHSEGALKEIVDPAWGVSPRRAYQTFGTDWGRSMICDDIWLKYAEHTAAQHYGMLITDLRFENEAAWVRRRNGLIVHVRRAGDFGIQSDHPSERGIAANKADYCTDACVDLDALYHETGRILDIVNRGVEAV